MGKDFNSWNYYLDLYKPGIKQPHSSIEKNYFKCEYLLYPERQAKNQLSCFYGKDQSKIGTFETDTSLIDIRGRVIEPNDIVIVTGKINKPILHHWKVLYPKKHWKKTILILQCITPGYEQYRYRALPEDVLVQTDQILNDAERRHVSLIPKK